MMFMQNTILHNLTKKHFEETNQDRDRKKAMEVEIRDIKKK